VAQDQYNCLSEFVTAAIAKYEIMTIPENAVVFVRAAAKANALKSDVAYPLLKLLYANKDKVQQVDEAMQLCYPIIAGEFERMEEKQVEGKMCKLDLLGLQVQPFIEILHSDDLMCGSEDAVYEFALKYIETNANLTDAERLDVMRTVRYTFMSLHKLQGLVKELSDPVGRAVIKAMHTDLMQALYARVNRTEGSSDSADAPAAAASGNENQGVVPANPKLFKPRMRRVFVYQSDFDTNGILYWIGCNYGTAKYENPSVKNYVKLTASTTFESGKIENLISHTPCACNMHSQANANFTIDFQKISIAPTKYTLRHTDSRDTECIRNWKLEASKDGQTWVLLREHKDDQAIAAKSQSFTWDINDSKKEFYRYFKIEQTGNNSANSAYFNLAGVEIYGMVSML